MAVQLKQFLCYRLNLNHSIFERSLLRHVPTDREQQAESLLVSLLQ